MNSQSPKAKQLLFVRGAGGQVHHLAERLDLVPRALAEDVKRDRQAMQRGVFRHRAGLAGDAQAGARGIQRRGRAGKKPVFQALHQMLFLFRLLDFREARRVGVREQLGREGAAGAEEQNGGFLKALLAPGGKDARPPVMAGKILARKGELLKIILQQEPGALGVVAVGKNVEDFGPFGHGGFGVGQFTAQSRLGAIGIGQHLVMGIVFRRAAQTAGGQRFFAKFWSWLDRIMVR